LRGYQFHGKDYAHERVDKLVETVRTWIPDPHEPGRQIGWITEPTDLYCRPLRRIGVRCRKKNGKWGKGVILSSLPPQRVLELTAQPPEALDDPQAVLLAYVYFYDQRGGGVEIEIKEDKQGLGTSKRNKKRFEAQQMLVHWKPWRITCWSGLAVGWRLTARTWRTGASCGGCGMAGG
jgi:hypothetical protein